MLFCTGVARYSICQNDPHDCSKNFIYSCNRNLSFILNATIVFVNSGTESYTEYLLDSGWELIVPPGNIDNSQIIRNNGTFLLPGIDITIFTLDNFRSNIAIMNIRNACVPFQIVHLVHTYIDDGDSDQISVTFNFNHKEGEKTTHL